MTRINSGSSGFSFGSAPIPDEEEEEVVVDAVEVNGEPISRKEASRLGLNFDASRDVRDRDRESKSSTNIFKMDQLPGDISDDLARKLEQAWTHLKRNAIEEALTLAQEVVWQYPALVAAKLIIARCFINRKEYEKALNILQAISENEMSAETMYYIGLAQSRLGRVKEAIAALNLSRASAADNLTRKRVNELLAHLQGEQALCPVCGKKALFDSMVEVGNRMVCANCAKSAGENDGVEGETDEDGDFSDDLPKRRKRLRRPLTRTEILLRILFVLILATVFLGVLYFFFPHQYTLVRFSIPGAEFVLPPPPFVPPPQPPVAPAAEQPRVVPSLTFDSSPVGLAIAGVEFRHRAEIASMRDRDGVYEATVSPVPAGPYSMNAKTGEFVWTPSPEDAGVVFTVTFDAVFKDIRARGQSNSIRVSRGAAAERIGDWLDPEPGSAVHIIPENLTGDAGPELVLVSGLSWQGNASIMTPGEGGRSNVVSRVNLGGRPAGAGIIIAGGEKWLAVADFWNSRLRYFVFRDKSLSEIAAFTALPGKPVLAGFGRDNAISAVLCRTESGMRLLAFDQSDQLSTAEVGNWSVPDDVVWRGLFVFPRANDNSPPTLALIGGDAARSLVFHGDDPDGARPLEIGVEGTVVAVTRDPDGKRLHFLIDDEGGRTLASVDPTRPNDRTSRTVEGIGPALGGLVAANLTDADAPDMLFLGDSRVGISFADQDGGGSAPYFWPLPSPPLPFGTPGVLADRGKRKVVYADAKGGLWAIGMEE